MENINIIWQESLRYLQQNVPQQQFNTWIRPLGVGIFQDRLMVYAPNAVSARFVEDTYKDKICQAVSRQHGGTCPPIEFKVGVAIADDNDSPELLDGSNTTQGGKVTGSDDKQAINDHRNSQHQSINTHTRPLNKEHTLANFVVGDSNKMAFAGAMRVVEACGLATHNPFFICGGVGLGKTHLMHAIGNEIKSHYRNKTIVCCNSEDFVNDMVRCIRYRTMEDFKNYYRRTDVLLIDDVQFFIGREKCQEEIFHTIDQVRENNGQIVLTCDQYPNKMRGLQARLRSRFSWGLTAAIDAPELETRAAIVMKKANDANHAISEDIALYIAKRSNTNVRELQGILNQVLAKARYSRSDITLELVQAVLRDSMATNDRGNNLEDIKANVCRYYGIRSNDLLSRRRSRSVVRPRQMAMYLARNLTRHSLPEIGQFFGGRDHTTVLHACRNIATIKNTDSEIAADCQNLTRTLSE